jgi:ribosomal protein L37AE/L43A
MLKSELLDEPELAELVHEEVHSRPRGTDQHVSDEAVGKRRMVVSAPVFRTEQIAGRRWRSMVGTMPESRVTEPVGRPAACPFCNSKRFDTLAKVITVNTWWRCRDCEATWSIASQRAASPRS